MRDVVLFAVLPYAALTLFIAGHIWRYRHDQFGWTTRTSQVLEKRWLAWGSPLFHVGALLAILGHVAGLLIPESWTHALGIPEDIYHLVAVIGGVIAGVLLCAGLIILLLRRFLISQRIRLVTTPMDIALYVLFGVEIALGMWQTLANLFGSGYEYRGTISVWFRQLFVLQPDVSLMVQAPVIFQAHALIALAILAIWPFTRLVHVWSIPLGYLVRPYVVYRRKLKPAAVRSAVSAER